MSSYSLSLGIATFASTVLGQLAVNKIGKKNTYLFAAVYGTVGFLALRMFGSSNPVIYTGIVCLTILGAGTVATAGLAFIGYEANMEVTDQFISNLMDIICYIPAGCGVIAFLFMIFYSLSDRKLSEYMEVNKLRRAEAEV